MSGSSCSRRRCVPAVFLLGLVLFTAPQLRADQAVYTDALQNGWQNWSWATVGFNNSSPVHAGSAAISVTCTNYEALYLHHDAFDASAYGNLTFWIHGGPGGGQPLQVQATISGNPQAVYNLPNLPPNTWQQISIPLATLGVGDGASMDGFWIQSRTSSQLAPFYVDDILLTTGTSPPPTTNAPALITVDAALNRHAISDLIYGTAFASSNDLAALHATMNRMGGNAETRYNWQLNAHNRGADWYFQSIADSPATAGAAADDHVASSKAAGAEPLVTIPMIEWMPKLGPSRAKLASYSIAKYGPQTGSDTAYFPDAGNGISVTNNTPITWNDPNDANFPTNSDFQKAWVMHLTNRWGLSTNGGVRYYILDNEETLWFQTHRDVHPVGPTMQEIRDKVIDYATMVKSVDPAAFVVAPEEWGWNGYLYSGYDQQWAGDHGDYNTSHYPDRAANGGWDYLPWLLDQLRQYSAAHSNRRLLDVFTVHIYPQGQNEFGDDVSPATQQGRNRSTRALWDTNYVDASWINNVIALVPRLRGWVNTYYPGTRIGITEYSWGADNHINGATAQADILGILGRENLDLATRWGTPDAGTPVFKAFQMYRNYDGNHSTFGQTSVFAGGPNPDNVAVFAAQRTSDSALTILVINKYLSGYTPLSVTLTNFAGAGIAQVWQLNSTNVITRLPHLAYSSSALNALVPRQSITLFVIPPRAAALQAGATRGDGQFEFWLNGEIGQTFILQTSTNLAAWTSIQTNTLASPRRQYLLPATAARSFYRALRRP